MARCIVFLLALLFAAQPVLALTIAPPTGHINDRAEMLDAATVQRLESFLTDFERSDSTQIAVLTVPNLGGQPLEAFSLAVVEQWGLGQKGKDNGALLFIARDERGIRIEVGYGLEGRLTDLTAGRIIRNIITPAFRQGNFDLGVTRGVEAMVAAVRGEYQADGSSGANEINAGNDYAGILIFFLFGSFIIGRIFGRPLAAVVGGGFSFLLGWKVFGGISVLLLLVTVAGAIASFLASGFAQRFNGHGGFGRGYYGGFGGGFGGSGFGGGGFSGGGGGFGGGGASGGW